jgi:vitamin B12 transporter
LGEWVKTALQIREARIHDQYAGFSFAFVVLFTLTLARGLKKEALEVKRNIVLAALGFCLLAPHLTLAQTHNLEPVVVTATRMETPSSEVASSVTVITSEEIENKQKTTVLEVLRSVPALDVVQQGGAGQQTSVFIRGAKSEHTLIMIDGVELNDPITPGRSYDFAHLTTDNIERIEIIRGPQSTLYGSDAIGGVINIITQKGKGKPAFFVSAEGGSFDTFRESAGGSGGNDLVHYSLGISRLDADGISAASKKDGNREKDGYENTSVSAGFGLTPTENFDVDVTLRHVEAEADVDNGGGIGQDDPNLTAEAKQTFLRTQARLALFDGLWEQTLGFSLSDHERKDHNDTDADHPLDLLRSSYESQLLQFDWQHNLYLNKANTVTFGLEHEKEEGKSDYYSESFYGPYSSKFEKKTARTTGYYFQDQAKWGDVFFITLGVRLDDHSKFGTETTYRIAPVYIVEQTGTRIRATYGTGFKAPSLYQLYSSFGDRNLDPEKSVGWDIGIEQPILEKRITLSATYFDNDFDDLIDYDYATSTYKNVDEAESKGIELAAFFQPVDDLSFRASYTYTDTEDKTTREDLLRRAKNKIGAEVNYRFLERGNVNLGATYVGERDDYDLSTWPATRIELDSYTLVNLAASFDVTENVRIFARVDNLLDEDYEEVKGYGTPGIAGYAGAKVSF